MTLADLTVDIVPIVGPTSPVNDATVPGRYLEPSLFTLMERRPPFERNGTLDGLRQIKS
jgi:hypothetical protein